ncbi:hypothetical protein TNCV_2719521 [Trichonephila clavipes]|nr:hypothetical protein TNCV_2719521 [Trichonephila clavipes]
MKGVCKIEGIEEMSAYPVEHLNPSSLLDFCQYLEREKHTSSPQVRGSNPGLDKVDSAFNPFRGLINEFQVFLGTKHWEFLGQNLPDRKICSRTSGCKVKKMRWVQQALAHHGLLRH